MEKRVAVCGMGVISPVGNTVPEFWDSLVNGRNGISLIKDMDLQDLPVKVSADVKGFSPADYGIEAPLARKQDLFTLYALAASIQAVSQSGLKSGENIDASRFGVYVGSGIGGFTTIYREIEKMVKDGPKWVAPTFVPTMIPNMAAGHIAIRHGACGPCLPITTACATSTNTIGEAYRAIRHGYADAIIAGGTEAARIPIGIAGFCNARTLSRSADPDYASIPFNSRRDGFVLGEGAAVLVLEEYEHAKARGAHILAEICGYGNSCDAYNATAPRPDGSTQAAAIRMALDQAGYTSDDCLYINAHGTSTPLNDVAETKAFKLALGDDAYRAHISSTKSMTGHALGAAGAIEAVASVMALMEGIVPPTINLDSPDPECDLDYTPCKAVRADLSIAISDSLGFGGHNACIAFRKAE
ncbi:MAG: beta-ketoacyl-ACP synthase II [Candidatus Cryptobacteroides sp.]|nr:beta-ketoacyl-ACP synthase II [Bacteroidales bacterium]MDY2858705.1 beta-ketoacyl-ACP synthase II [Candidatus Cryptobacteroides sp.]MDY5743949.1 beta-ketoacyl-ACP synthase II [Candidatus Cryptobacteroides sp.]